FTPVFGAEHQIHADRWRVAGVIDNFRIARYINVSICILPFGERGLLQLRGPVFISDLPIDAVRRRPSSRHPLDCIQMCAIKQVRCSKVKRFRHA
ncbi:hypothetical protein ACFFQG_24930, partial [Shinella granuli]